MKIDLLLQKLYENKVKLSVKDGQLKYVVEAGGTLNETLKQELRDHRDLLIHFITQEQSKAKHLNEVRIEAQNNRHSSLPLTQEQQGLWFLQKINPESYAYNMVFAYSVQGLLNVEILREAFLCLVERQDALRLSFFEKDGQVSQRVLALEEVKIDFSVIDVSKYNRARSQKAAKEIVFQETIRPFDLSQDFLTRIKVIQLSEKEFILVISQHHIISDAWSFNVFVQELSLSYNALLAGKKPVFETLEVNYADYVLWQKAFLSNNTIESQIAYWRKKLDGFSPLEFPCDFDRPAHVGFEGAAYSLFLEEDLVMGLKQIASQHRVTLYSVLLSAFYILLSKYTGQLDIVVGSPFANRQNKQIHRTLGFFVNTLVLRGDLSNDPNFNELIHKVHGSVLDAYENQNIPFERIVNALGVNRDASRNPIFQVLFELESESEGLHFSDMIVRPFAVDFSVAKFDLTFSAYEQVSQGKIRLNIDYNTDLYQENSVIRLADHFVWILRQVVQAPQKRLSDIRLLTEKEYQQLIMDENNTDVRFETHKRAYQIFEEQAAKKPHAIAVTYEGVSLSYDEVNRKANQLAHKLKACGVSTDDFVIFMLDRNNEYLIAMLGVWKAGGAFIPLNPRHPNEKNRRVLDQVASPLLLTSHPYAENTKFLSGSPDRVLILEDILSEGLSEENPTSYAAPHDLAYVIFTSGSTGAPKGAMVQHDGMLNHLCCKVHDLGLTDQDNTAQIATQVFDVSVWQYMATLLVGGRVTVFTEESAWDPILLLPNLSKFGITIFESVPTHMLVMLEELERYPSHYNLSKLKWFIMNGEPLQPDLCNRWFKLYPNVPMLNAYGPTECSDDVTHFKLHGPVSATWRYVPVNGTLPNMKLYLLDSNLNPVPVGVKGELYIGGVGVGRGYLNDPVKTAQSFIPNPFSGKPGDRMYKTGDLMRRHANGELEFLSRVDNQVKIRGFRIELGEIEARLTKHVDIAEAVVKCISVSDHIKHLVGYVTIVEGKNPTVTSLRRFLLELLPDYMVPTLFIFVDKMPLTASGKLDRNALVDPKPEEFVNTEDYVPASTSTEKTLVKIWSQVLKIDAAQLGINHNFFELGGDSIISIQIVASARQANLHLSPRLIFEHQTIAALAAAADVAGVRNVVAEQGMVKGGIALTPIQLWFFENQGGFPNHYNQAVAIDIEHIQLESFEESVRALIAHHDILRLRLQFDQSAGEWEQYYSNATQLADCYSLLHYDFTGLDTSEQFQKVVALDKSTQASLDIKVGPLLAIAMCKLSDSKTRVMLAMHHFVVDGVSMRILLKDLYTLYHQALQRKTFKLPEKTTSFKYWSESLCRYAASEVLHRELLFWLAQYKEISHWKKRPENTYGNSKTIARVLDVETTHSLIKQVPEVFKTQVNDILLTALILTQEGSYRLDLEGHGREDLFDDCDLSRTMGWFTSIFPVHLSVPDVNDIGGAIVSIKEQLRKIPNKGIGYGILRYLAQEPSIVRTVAENGTASLLFNYLGQFDSVGEGFPFSSLPNRGDIGDAVLRSYLLEMNSMILNQQLRINFTYCPLLTSDQELETFADQYVRNLQRVIQFCKNAKTHQFTPSDFPAAALDQKQLNRALSLIEKVDQLEALYPLSPLQEGMLYHKLNDPNSEEYFVQLYFKLPGDIAVAALKQAWEFAILKYAALRTGFVYDALDRPQQFVLKNVPIQWTELDWADVDSETQHQQLLVYLANDRQKGFDLTQPSLIRFSVIKLSSECYQFIWSNHHIILDGWCLPVILRTVANAYENIVVNQPIALSKEPAFDRYISWIHKQDKVAAKAYWQSCLAGYEVPHRLGHPVAHQQSLSKKYIRTRWAVSHDLTQKMQLFAQEQKLTVNTLVQGVWGYLLTLYSGQNDVVFGATVSGRPAELDKVEQMVGLFINTLPVRASLSADLTVSQYLQNLQQQGLESRDFGYVSLAEIQAWANCVETGLFETLLIYENYPEDSQASHTLRMYDFQAIERTNYPLTVFAYVSDRFHLNVDYDVAQFSQKMIDEILRSFEAILISVMENINQPITQIPLAVPEQAIVGQRLPTSTNTMQLIHTLFEQRVLEMPDAIAVYQDDRTLTYQTLNQKANQLAQFLREKGATPDSAIGIYATHSCELLIGLLAILKAGAAYLPLDVSYPEDRLTYMLKNSGTRIVIGKNIPAAFYEIVETAFEMDQINVENYSIQNLTGFSASPHNLSYIIYTSGTTGLPKGVLIEHRTVAHFLQSMQAVLGVTPQDRILLQTPLSFDISALEVFLPLISGAAVVILDSASRNQADRILETLSTHQVSIMQATPTGWQMLIEANPDTKLPPTILSGGEPLSETLAQKLLQRADRVLNVYGPTEATIWASVARLNADEPVSLGIPLDGIEFHILNQNRQAVSVGGVGELYIGGDCLARGYLGKPELTAERFIEHCTAEGRCIRLYKTGDLVRRITARDLVFVGRVDDQVKVRGYRIELGEIESCIMQSSSQITHCVVVVVKDAHQQPQLIAYYVVKPAETLSIDHLRQNLKNRLPPYMVPVAFVAMDKLPLTPSGKLDRKALPKPQAVQAPKKLLQTPQNHYEHHIFDVYRNVLNLSQSDFGTQCNFFEIGGHSLYAIQVVSRVNGFFSLNLPIRTVFDYPTVSALAEQVSVLHGYSFNREVVEL